MQVPDHIVQSAKQELKDTVHKLSMEILDKLQDDTDSPLIALCVIQACQYVLIRLIVEKCDPLVTNDDFKISSCEITQLYSQLIEPVMTDHMMKIALHSVIAHKITKSSEQN